MRSFALRAVPAALLCALTAGCGIGEASEGQQTVPTLSVRPSPSTTPSTESGFTIAPDPSESHSSEGTRSAQPSADGSPSAEPAAGPVDLGTAPTSYDEAAAYVAKARDDGGTRQERIFRTPEDIYCVMSSDYMDPACELPQGAGIEDSQACGNAMGDRVGRIEVAAQRARAVCNTDTIRETVPETLEPVVVVTDATSGLACAVADIGVTCVQSRREIGFFLGLDSYDTFG